MDRSNICVKRMSVSKDYRDWTHCYVRYCALRELSSALLDNLPTLYHWVLADKDSSSAAKSEPTLFVLNHLLSLQFD